MPEGKRFGSPATLELGIRWVDDPEPPEQRPAGYGWSMGQLTIRVAGVNVTATMHDGVQQPFVGWYLAPFLDWLATNWADLLHEERLPWPNPRGPSAATACNHALEEWTTADDRQGRQHYGNAQGWYFRHGVRSAAAGGIFPDLFIRRVADDIELSWSGRPMAFTQDGLAFESGSGHARLPAAETAQTIWQLLDWAVGHPPKSPDQYRDHIEALKAKVESLRDIENPTLAQVYVHPAILKKAEEAFAAIERDLLEGGEAANDVPCVAELPPAVAMFGGVSPYLGIRDVECLRDHIVATQGGGDSAELGKLVADRHGSTLGIPHRDAQRFADELLEDMPRPAGDFVDVRAMCSQLGIDVQEIELETDSIRGVAIAGEGFSPRIVVNQKHYFNQNESGQRFTVAHELCHVLFDRTRARRIAHVSGQWAAPGIEQRANAFAAYLLMPRPLVLKHLRDANRIEKGDVQQLADRLRVNHSALLPHMQNLGLIDVEHRDRLRDELGSVD